MLLHHSKRTCVFKIEEPASQDAPLLQAISAADTAQSSSSAKAALAEVDALLQPDQAPGSQDLRRLKHQLQLQLSRCNIS